MSKNLVQEQEQAIVEQTIGSQREDFFNSVKDHTTTIMSLHVDDQEPDEEKLKLKEFTISMCISEMVRSMKYWESYIIAQINFINLNNNPDEVQK